MTILVKMSSNMEDFYNKILDSKDHYRIIVTYGNHIRLKMLIAQLKILYIVFAYGVCVNIGLIIL